jgi:hypothetical protein
VREKKPATRSFNPSRLTILRRLCSLRGPRQVESLPRISSTALVDSGLKLDSSPQAGLEQGSSPITLRRWSRDMKLLFLLLTTTNTFFPPTLWRRFDIRLLEMKCPVLEEWLCDERDKKETLNSKYSPGFGFYAKPFAGP